jgi:hypothetical protein
MRKVRLCRYGIRRGSLNGGPVTDVVAIHGIAMNRRSRAEMTQVWHSALVRGLENVRYPRADGVELECAFYGHLYNDGKSAADITYQLADLNPGLEQELFQAIGDSAEKDRQTQEWGDERQSDKVWLDHPLQRALRQIERQGVFDGVASTVIRLVKQVGRYFEDKDFAQRAQDELATAMEAKPRVLVAHSLGSVIAYDWLRRQSPTSVASFITIGSPLGFRGIRKALYPDLDRSLPPWPKVPVWVNVAAAEDPIATVKKLNGLFDGSITDRPARNPRRTAHSAAIYLQNVHTATALKAALG